MALVGIGVGTVYAMLAKLIVDSVEPAVTGVAIGMNTVMRTIGGVIGGQIGAALLTSITIAGTTGCGTGRGSLHGHLLDCGRSGPPGRRRHAHGASPRADGDHSTRAAPDRRPGLTAGPAGPRYPAVVLSTPGPISSTGHGA